MTKREQSPHYDPDLVPMPAQDRDAGKELTSLQRLAERTDGIVTPANLVTIMGIGLTLLGCREYARGNRKKAVGLMAAGAACDALDGQVARQTRTANYQVGRYLDIGADGVKSIAVAKTLYNSGSYGGGEIIANYGPKLLGWLANGYSRFVAGNDPKTSMIGKAAEVSRWVSPGLAVAADLAKENGQDTAAGSIRRASRITAIGSCVLGLAAANGYLASLKRDRSNRK